MLQQICDLPPSNIPRYTYPTYLLLFAQVHTCSCYNMSRSCFHFPVKHGLQVYIDRDKFWQFYLVVLGSLMISTSYFTCRWKKHWRIVTRFIFSHISNCMLAVTWKLVVQNETTSIEQTFLKSYFTTWKSCGYFSTFYEYTENPDSCLQIQNIKRLNWNSCLATLSTSAFLLKILDTTWKLKM